MLRVFSIFRYDMIAQSVQALIESVLLTKVHDESQIVCSKMHQRGNVKKCNICIGKSFIGSMHEGNIGHLNDPY